MASIKRTNKAGESLTIITVDGILTLEEVKQAFENFIQKDVTTYLLWDFTDADFSQVTQKDIDQMIAFAKSKAGLRKNGRTAFVVNHDVAFGVSRMYETLSEIKRHPISHNVFRDINKALTWLKTGEHNI